MPAQGNHLERRALDDFEQPDWTSIEERNSTPADRRSGDDWLNLAEPGSTRLCNGCGHILGDIAEVVNLILIACGERVRPSLLIYRMDQLDERFAGARVLALQENQLRALVGILDDLPMADIAKREEVAFSCCQFGHDEADVVHASEHASTQPPAWP